METYCLDANFFIQAWNKYYSPDFFPNYWEYIDSLGQQGRLFVSDAVKDEIGKKDDTLKVWLDSRPHLVKKRTPRVGQFLTQILGQHPTHKFLVSQTGRSAADPWVIAHAMAEGAVVVSKEERTLTPITNKIKIPDVCNNMGVRCIDDFGFIRELNLKFHCIV